MFNPTKAKIMTFHAAFECAAQRNYRQSEKAGQLPSLTRLPFLSRLCWLTSEVTCEIERCPLTSIWSCLPRHAATCDLREPAARGPAAPRWGQRACKKHIAWWWTNSLVVMPQHPYRWEDSRMRLLPINRMNIVNWTVCICYFLFFKVHKLLGMRSRCGCNPLWPFPLFYISARIHIALQFFRIEPSDIIIRRTC